MAGGRSSRMGRDKALLCEKGEAWWQRQTRILAASGADPVWLSRRGGQVVPEGCMCIHDLVTDRGPLAGIQAALKASPPSLGGLACDRHAGTGSGLVPGTRRALHTGPGSPVAQRRRLSGTPRCNLATHSAERCGGGSGGRGRLPAAALWQAAQQKASAGDAAPSPFSGSGGEPQPAWRRPADAGLRRVAARPGKLKARPGFPSLRQRCDTSR